jgi:NAD(P)-dependent dehydrogenase (short-subunit alcohol dehydrogenase family)
MKTNGGGNIVNVTSEAARFGGTNLAHYAASKAALNTFTIGFAREVAPYNIRVNAVSPGVIDTEIHAGSTPERIENLLKSLPMKRMGKSSEVADLIHWLLTDAASYLSGAIIPITGSR